MSSALESMHPLIYPAEPLVTTAGVSLWWLLLAVCPLLLLIFWLWHKRPQLPPSTLIAEPANQLAAALQQLEQLPKPAAGEQAGPWLQQLNLLLKRFCAVRYPEVATHRLGGREWLAFLDSRCPAAGLTRWMVLVQGSYLPDCRLSDTAVEDLHHAVTVWMRAHV